MVKNKDQMSMTNFVSNSVSLLCSSSSYSFPCFILVCGLVFPHVLFFFLQNCNEKFKCLICLTLNGLFILRICKLMRIWCEPVSRIGVHPKPKTSTQNLTNDSCIGPQYNTVHWHVQNWLHMSNFEIIEIY